MTALLKRGVDVLDRFANGQPFRTARGFSATLYLVVALLAALQLVNPGAVQRIASQAAGSALLAALAVLLLVVALFELADVGLRRPRNALEPGFGDVLLHSACAWAGLELSVLQKLLPSSTRLAACGALGFCLIIAGVYRLLRSARPGETDDNEFRARKLCALSRRDHLTRGASFAILGAFLVAVAVGAGFDVTRGPWTVALLALTVLALAGYGLHTIWTLQEEDRSWAL
jgi:hypothetical protein